jgi:hypothetical protein
VAEDYFAAMQRVEERLNILPGPEQENVIQFSWGKDRIYPSLKFFYQ